MFKKIAAHLSAHPFHRHVFFLMLALLAAFINGYHFGTFDQVFHITFLKKFINPDLYPNDPFLSLRWFHFSYFWYPFIPLLKAGILEIGMFIIHILTVYGIFWMFWALSDLLFHQIETNLLLTLALIIPHIGLPGFQIIEFSLLNRTFVLPFLLGSIWLYLKDRKHLAYLLIGLMFNLHAIYSAFVLCMFLLDEALKFSWPSWWKPILRLAIFVLAGIPVLIWRMQTGNGIDFTLRPKMLELATDGLLYTVYYPVGTASFVLGNFFAGIGTLWAFILGFRQAPNNEKHRTMRNFVLAIGMLVTVSIIVSYLLPVTILLQLQLLRAGIFLLYFGMLYFAFFICQQYSKGNITRGTFWMLSLGFILLISPLISILLFYLAKGLEKLKCNPAWLIPVICIIQALTAYTATKFGYWSPGFHIFGPESAWQEVQLWARNHTPNEAKFITPPHEFWHYIPDWRVFSERATVATIPEMMEIPFDPSYAENFKSRFEAVAPGAIEQFNGNYVRTLEITKEMFYTNTTEDFQKIACEFSADYLVVDKEHPYNFSIAFENAGFIIYFLPACP